MQYVKGMPPIGKLAAEVEREIQTIKRGEKWRLDFMTWEMEMLVREELAAEKAEKKGEEKGRNAAMTVVIRNMADAKMGMDVIAKVTGLSAKEIGALAKKHKIAL